MAVRYSKANIVNFYFYFLFFALAKNTRNISQIRSRNESYKGTVSKVVSNLWPPLNVPAAYHLPPEAYGSPLRMAVLWYRIEPKFVRK